METLSPLTPTESAEGGDVLSEEICTTTTPSSPDLSTSIMMTLKEEDYDWGKQSTNEVQFS